MDNRSGWTATSIDANGCLTERVVLDGQDVIVHYDDLPDSDVSLIDGVRCTTALHTVIDIAPEATAADSSEWSITASPTPCSPSTRRSRG